MKKLPTLMYIHGFRSGANGSKYQELQQHFEGQYRVIAPDGHLTIADAFGHRCSGPGMTHLFQILDTLTHFLREQAK